MSDQKPVATGAGCPHRLTRIQANKPIDWCCRYGMVCKERCVDHPLHPLHATTRKGR